MDRIIKSHRGIYYVEQNNKVILCKARGVFRDRDIKPIVGDLVDISINDDGTGYIEKVYERKNQLLRPPLANIDQVIIIMSLKDPKINLNLLDKYILMLEKSNLEIKIIFNKVDLVKDKDMEYISSIYANIGYDIYFNSNVKESNLSLDRLFEDKITAVVGPSGVGKSTTLNKIFSNFNFDTGEISVKNKKGKHTTRHIEMSKLSNNSYIIDTPGFSSLSLEFIDERNDIKDNFIEFRKYANKCKYNDCYHINEPVCGVKLALEEKIIAKERYENYKQILNEYDKIRRF
ncbi:ribosome small subunit-dependent GTPase A [Miniphocaeibacter massiliensis]|uniref:ribosome small subunit-dependent GTPase A n=1 Tax=Miniphocaeibacter massiliensis TaxID=2041841 RepID=UPI000C06B871|nr:ribosome small subunit-dependent GTPase A [Miniphocaeibacter massiliensis]